MICPKCGAEYTTGFTRCSDCQVALIGALPPREKDPTKVSRRDFAAAPRADLITVFAAADFSQLALAKSLLRSAGIPFETPGEMQMPIGTGASADLQVLARDADDARQVLQGLLDPSRAERQ
jgi:hypothetical protein